MKILYFQVTHASTAFNRKARFPAALREVCYYEFSMKKPVKYSNPLLIKSSGSA